MPAARASWRPAPRACPSRRTGPAASASPASGERRAGWPAAPSDNPFPVREALREIVAEHGPEALSRPPLMSSLLADFLPDDQPVVRLLVAAAGERIAESLLDHVAHGMDTATAVRLAASAL